MIHYTFTPSWRPGETGYGQFDRPAHHSTDITWAFADPGCCLEHLLAELREGTATITNPALVEDAIVSLESGALSDKFFGAAAIAARQLRSILQAFNERGSVGLGRLADLLELAMERDGDDVERLRAALRAVLAGAPV